MVRAWGTPGAYGGATPGPCACAGRWGWPRSSPRSAALGLSRTPTGMPRRALARVQAGGGWPRSSPRPWGGAVTCATTDRPPHPPPRRTPTPATTTDPSPHPPPRRTRPHTRHHDGPVPTPPATTDPSPYHAPQRARPRTPRPAGPLAAYGGQGTGWGVSARSGRRPLPGTAEGTATAGPRTDTPHPGPDPPTTPHALHTPPPKPKRAAAGIQGRGELRTTPAPTAPAATRQPHRHPISRTRKQRNGPARKPHPDRATPHATELSGEQHPRPEPPRQPPP
ncbi:hypothetical protein SCANM124S_03592 [Streptomyces canus]